MLTHWNEKFLRIQENLEKCFLTKLAKCAAKESFQGRRSEHSSGKFRFLSAFFSVKGQSEISLFPEDQQDHQTCWICRNSLSLFWVVSIGLTLMYLEIKYTYCFFKHMYLKKTFLLENRTNTAAVHSIVSSYCPNRKWRLLCKEKSSKSIKNRQSWLTWADIAEMLIPSAQRAITRK